MATPLLASLPLTGSAAAASRATLVVPLDMAVDVAACGNKACNLARLSALGFAVPPAVVLTNTALDLFLDGGELREPIARIRRELPGNDAAATAIAAEAIQVLIFATVVPYWLRDTIEQAVAHLAGGPLIARSSASGEDSRGHSFAGQLDSFGDLTSAQDAIQAVVKVWASRWSCRAMAYASAGGVMLESMGVILQRQVPARWSGVLFTEAPDNPVEMLMEFCAGPGEALVSGRINPGRVNITRSTRRWTLAAAPDQPSAPIAALSDASIAEIARAGLAIERVFGTPQDIEWTIDDAGRLWVVQARPITTAAAPAADAPTAPAPGTPLTVWSNANISENFPHPVSPLLYSIASAGYYHYFRNLGRSFGLSRRRLDIMEQPLRHIIGLHGARLYYNLTSIHAVLRSAPGGDLLAASFNQFVGASATDTRAVVPFVARARNKLTLVGEVGRIAVQTARQYLFVARRVARFEQRVDAFAAVTHPSRLARCARRDLLDHLRGFLHIRCNQWNDAALADAGAMVCYGVLQRLLTRAFPGEDQQALHNSLLKALPDLVSGRPAIELWRLAEQVRANPDLTTLFAAREDAAVLAALDRDGRFEGFRAALARFQEAWGFRCSGELMLTTPSFQEEPAPLISLIRGYLASDSTSPSRILEQQAAERVAETARIARELGARRVGGMIPRFVHRAVVLRVLRWTQTCICLRERARLKQALLYSRLRRIALAAGARLRADGRLEHADDVFFLTSDEIDALLSGGAMFPGSVCELVALRRRDHAALAACTPPDTFSLRDGEYFSSATACQPGSPTGKGSDLTGIGACGGSVTARAAVLSDVRESPRLRAGDILVTRQTDPGWAPVFPLIAGLVVERGGMLSHGAIIAREFGIPSVVGVCDATRRIAHGAVVTVDANRGVVTVAGEAP